MYEITIATKTETAWDAVESIKAKHAGETDRNRLGSGLDVNTGESDESWWRDTRAEADSLAAIFRGVQGVKITIRKGV